MRSRRRTALLAVMGLTGALLLSAPPSASAANLVKNPGFEGPITSAGLPGEGWWQYQARGETKTNNVLVLEVEGKVEVSRSASAPWDPAYTNQVLVSGDRGRTARRSRTALRLFDLSVRLGDEGAAREWGRRALAADANMRLDPLAGLTDSQRRRIREVVELP